MKNTNSKDEIIELFYYYHYERTKLSDEAKKSWKILERAILPPVRGIKKVSKLAKQQRSFVMT